MDFNENGFKFSDDENLQNEENASYDQAEENVDLNTFLNDEANSNKEENKKGKFKFNFKFIKNSKIKKGTVLKVVLSVFLIGVITACIIAGAFIVYAFNFVDATMNENLYDLANLEFSTTIYYEDSEGNWKEDTRLHGEFNRIWASDAEGEIPDNLKNAFIAIEDERFRTHTGVDWKRTFSAFANLFLHFYS
ncbi:MAG: transglycosylase domain-containing protein, partial [Clostridia bacterium]|nr:transglycosylase domain-containing protein [Clostridia bacterium]